MKSAYRLWFLERFPPINFISGVMLYVLPKCIANLSGARPWQASDFFAALIPGFHLFVLRIFDEHKDYESDLVHNPNRVLQRGLIQLKELKALGFAAGLLEFVILLCLHADAGSWIYFAVFWIWTLLMWKEFFVAAWLKKHFFWYGLSHLMITPLLLFFCATLEKAGSAFLPEIFALGLLTSWIYEVSRKTKAPEEETGDLSYSQIWGLKKACTVIAVQGLLVALVGLSLFHKLNLVNVYTLTALGLTVILHFASIAKFVKAPSKRARKSNEGTSALIGFAVFLSPVIADLITLFNRG